MGKPPMPETPGESHDVWTPLKVLQWAVPYLKEKGVESPRLDVECLLAKALHCDRLKVYLQYDRPLSREERGLLREWVGRRAKREPLAYLLGEREFFGLPFEVNPSVLIPRPESELLVEKAKAFLETLPTEERCVIDLGTGTGCLAVAIAHSVPDCRVWAVDRSQAALETAQRNAQKNEVEGRIAFRLGSWWSALQSGDPAKFNVLVSNPPYISAGEKSDLAPEITEYEPKEALFAGADGLNDYRAIQEGLVGHLQPGGKAFLELNSNISDKIIRIFEPIPNDICHDLQGLPRVLALFIPGFT
jgi:release factor glutamine methyltransferase